MATQEEQSLSEKMSMQITEKLESAIDSVIVSKNKEYQAHPEKIPTLDNVKSLINSVSLTNSAISGGASLVPGPWGMAAVIPEIILVSKNQIGLIYDIAAAHGQRNVMTKDLLATILLSAMGTSVGGLLTVHGGKYLVKRSSLRVFQQIITALGGKITQKVLKSTISKWLPGIGAAAMAAWANYTTRQIGHKANEIFNAGLVIEDGITDISIVDEQVFVADAAVENKESYEFIRLKILTNLAKIDGNVHNNEADFISLLIDKSDISDTEKTIIIARLGSKENDVNGLDELAKSPDDAIGLIADMVALANQDNVVHPAEKLYIKQIGKMLGFSESDVHDMFTAS